MKQLVWEPVCLHNTVTNTRKTDRKTNESVKHDTWKHSVGRCFLCLYPYNLFLLYENLVSSTVMNIKAWRNRGGRCWSWIKTPPCCWTLDHLTFYPPWQSYRERPGIRWKEKAQWSQTCTEWDTKSADDILHSWIPKLLKPNLFAKMKNCHYCLFDNNCN